MTLDQIFYLCVVALVVLATLLLVTVMRCLTLLDRERTRTEIERTRADRWTDYAAGLEQYMAAQDSTLDDHFAQTPAAAGWTPAELTAYGEPAVAEYRWGSSKTGPWVGGHIGDIT